MVEIEVKVSMAADDYRIAIIGKTNFKARPVTACLRHFG